MVAGGHAGEMILEVLLVHMQVLAHCFAVKLGGAADLADTQTFFEKILNFAIHG